MSNRPAPIAKTPWLEQAGSLWIHGRKAWIEARGVELIFPDAFPESLRRAWPSQIRISLHPRYIDNTVAVICDTWCVQPTWRLSPKGMQGRGTFGEVFGRWLHSFCSQDGEARLHFQIETNYSKEALQWLP